MKYSVDIEAGNALVNKLKKKAPSIGGFNGMMEIPLGYEQPLLVSGADGVGTKINICSIAFDYTTIGIDLVAMCANDVICSGAKPLYFLDYISTRTIDARVEDILSGIIKGCEIAEMELLGGETAEHYTATDYDLAGFCVGIVEKNKIIDGSKVSAGDCLLALRSSGPHSNGFSLIRKVLEELETAVVSECIDSKPLIDLLMTPTKIYVKEILKFNFELNRITRKLLTGSSSNLS